MSTKCSAIALVAVAVTLASCSSTTKFGGSTVRLSIVPDAASAGMTQLLAITVSGADTASFTLPASSDFDKGQPQTVDYHVVAGAGTLTFAVTASAYGSALAQGVANVVVARKSTVALGVMLVGVGGGDGGVPDSGVPDLGAPADLEGSFDLSGVDLGHGAIGASNGGVAYNPNAGDLSGVTAIDTSALTLTITGGPGNDGGMAGAPPSGVAFVASSDGKFAVLTVGKWTVDKEVRVSGTRGLVVVARQVDIADYIHLEAASNKPGPGGFGAGAGPGAGGPGSAGLGQPPFNQPYGTGGGGAGHLTAGGLGGNSPFGPIGLPGATYGSLTDLNGGSGGGQGGTGQFVCGVAGAGGGAIEIAANESITVEPSGIVNAGGGGPIVPNCSGAGSGGTLLLEARSLVVKGVLSANGGNCNLFGTPSDAILGSGVVNPSSGQGIGGTATAPPTPGQPGAFQSFGGGGAGGRIVLRTSGPYAADVHAASAISPAPILDSSLP